MKRSSVMGCLLLMASAAAAAETALSTATAPAPADAPKPFMTVNVPVADLRGEPKRVDGSSALKSPYAQDPLEESQLLYGERVKILVDKGAWLRVEAVEQAEYTHADAWTGYPGWVAKEALAPAREGEAPNAVVRARYAKVTGEPSRKEEGVMAPLGARLFVTFEKGGWVRLRRPDGTEGWAPRKDVRMFTELPADDAARREVILASAKLFLAEPYYWGGRAGHRDADVEAPSGVDCSGLVNLAYRVAGVDVPRDAHEQYMRSKPLESAADLKPGDLVFLAWTKNRDRMTHVMIYAGGDDLIEAVQEQNVVRQVTGKEKLGKPLKDVAVMTPVGDRYVYFGRLLPE